MKPTPPNEPARVPPADRERPAAPAYEPPAIAWEEPFESVSATSCGLVTGLTDQCSAKPTT